MAERRKQGENAEMARFGDYRVLYDGVKPVYYSIVRDRDGQTWTRSNLREAKAKARLLHTFDLREKAITAIECVDVHQIDSAARLEAVLEALKPKSKREKKEAARA